MRGAILGEAVTVLTPTQEGEDEYGQAVKSWAPREVADVLVCEPVTTDLGAGLQTDAGRPEGDSVSLTLHFPKSYSASLRGCRVELRGRTFEVLGDPVALTEGNVPGRWNRAAPVRLVEG